MRRAPQKIVGIGSLVCVVVCSCSLFEPREAEKPSESGVQYLPQTLEEEVIANLKTAIAQADEPHYMNCFWENFTFVSTSAFARELDGWTFTKESSFFRNLVGRQRQPNGYFNLTPTNEQLRRNNTDPALAEYQADYALTLELTDTTLTATGALKFTLRRQNSVWKISEWEDLNPSTPTTFTWSALKARFP